MARRKAHEENEPISPAQFADAVLKTKRKTTDRTVEKSKKLEAELLEDFNDEIKHLAFLIDDDDSREEKLLYLEEGELNELIKTTEKTITEYEEWTEKTLDILYNRTEEAKTFPLSPAGRKKLERLLNTQALPLLPELSSRISRYREYRASPIRKYMPYLQKAKEILGEDAEHIATHIGDPGGSIPIHKKAFSRFKAALENYVEKKGLAYEDEAGMLKLRELVALFYNEFYGTDFKVEDTFMFSGVSEAIDKLFATAFQPGDVLLVPEPYYTNYEGFADEHNLTLKPIPRNSGTDYDLPEEDPILALVEKYDAKAIILINPDNPTGKVYNEEELKRFGAVVHKTGIKLIADESYSELVHDPDAQFHSASALLKGEFEGIGKNIITMNSFSKIFTLPGARLGWMFTEDEELKEKMRPLLQTRLSSPSLSMLLAIEMLRDHEEMKEFFEFIRAEYSRKRDIALKGLADINGAEYNKKLQGAFYIGVGLPIDDADKFQEWLLTDFYNFNKVAEDLIDVDPEYEDTLGSTTHRAAFNNLLMTFAPMEGFYIQEKGEPTKGKNEIRIAYVTEDEKLEKFFKALPVAIDAYRILKMKQEPMATLS